MSYSSATRPTSTAIIVFPERNVRVTVPVARTIAEQVAGLRGRSVGPYEGMLFPRVDTMTMSGMTQALDFLYLNNIEVPPTVPLKVRVAEIQANVPAGRAHVFPRRVADWTLEMGPGFAAFTGVKEGSLVELHWVR